MKRAKRTIVILGLALASCRGPIYTPTATPQVMSVRIMATTTTYPLLQDFAVGFEQPGVRLAVSSQPATWEAIYNQMLSGTTPYALTSYVPNDVPLWVAPVGYGALVLVVNPANTVSGFTFEDLRNVFQGRVANWSDLGGPDLPVTVVSREEGADTRLTFGDQVMGARRTTLAARLALSGSDVMSIVASTPGAIGYVGLEQIDSRVRVVPVAVEQGAPFVMPTRAAIDSGDYPLRMSIQIVGLGPPPENSVYRDWFAWMQSDVGQSLLRARFGGQED